MWCEWLGPDQVVKWLYDVKDLTRKARQRRSLWPCLSLLLGLHMRKSSFLLREIQSCHQMPFFPLSKTGLFSGPKLDLVSISLPQFLPHLGLVGCQLLFWHMCPCRQCPRGIIFFLFISFESGFEAWGRSVSRWPGSEIADVTGSPVCGRKLRPGNSAGRN